MWNKRDDKLRQNKKVRKALRLERLSMYLWDQVAIEVAGQATDGVVTRDVIDDVSHTLRLTDDEVEACISALVESGLWHGKASIRKCHCKVMRSALDEDGYFFHDWWDWNPTRDQAVIPIETLRWRRRQGLKHDRTLCTAIQERDGDRCRYCGDQVNWRDRVGPKGGTYDHLDPNCFAPNLGNFLEGVVVACRTCNGHKRDRTPEEWLADGGIELRPEPVRVGTGGRLGRDQVATRTTPTPDSVPTRSRGRGARETGRAGSRPGSDLVATRSTKEPK